MTFRARKWVVTVALVAAVVLSVAGCTATAGTAVRVSAITTPTGRTTAPSTASGLSSHATSSPVTSNPSPPSGQPTFPAPSTGPDGEVWSQSADKPLGQPVAAGDGVAVYVLHRSALAIEVLDAPTGTVRWQQPAATGAAAAGVAITPTLFAGHLVYLRPVGGSMTTSSVVVADADTGRDIAVSQQSYPIASRPAGCGNLICFSVFVGTDEQSVLMDPATGQVRSAGAGTGGRTIGPQGLESIQSSDHPETLTRIVDGKAVWSTPLSTVFGDGYSTNGGWVFHAVPAQNLLIGSVGMFDPNQATPNDLHLGIDLKMGGIDLTTGHRRWLQTGGVEYQCTPQDAIVEGGPLLNVRCRWGAATVAHRVGDKLVLQTASLSVEGFNPATGATTWTVALADPTGQTPQAAFRRIEVVGEDTLLVAGRAAAQLIDPVTGATRPAAADTQAVCVVAIQTPLAGGARTINGRTSNNYVTGSAATRCNANGTPTAKPSTSWPSWVGATVQHMHILTTTAGLQGYRN